MALSDRDRHEITQAIERASVEITTNRLREWFIPRQEHYDHHQFLRKWMVSFELMSKTATRTITAMFAGGIITMLLWGLMSWIKARLAGG